MTHFRPSLITSCIISNRFKPVFNYEPSSQRFQRMSCKMPLTNLKHLVCFNEWNAKMVLEVVCSAMRLKKQLGDSHQQKMIVLRNSKVMILKETNEPLLKMAVSKAASLLGADDVVITERLRWEEDYNGRIYSDMADIIFVSTRTHGCVKRFANKSSVPVISMLSRTHAPIQALATIMAIQQEFDSVQGLNIAYVGPPHPVLNSYLLIFPMLGAQIKFKCCCKVCPVSPLLLNESKAKSQSVSTTAKQCVELSEVLENASVIIAGPTTESYEKTTEAKEKTTEFKEKTTEIPEFELCVNKINKDTPCRWIFFHTCPRGKEVNDELFFHCKARTFTAFQNTHYIAAALMAYCIKDYKF